MVTKQNPVEKVKRFLEWLRSDKSISEYWRSWHKLRSALKRYKLSLADIGSSEEELEELKKNCQKMYAQKLVDSLRQDMEGYKVLVVSVVHETRSFSQAMINFNDSKNRVSQSWINEHKEAVAKLLSNLMATKNDYYNHLEQLRNTLHERNLSLSECGTSEDELASFSKLLTQEHLMKV